MCQGELLLEVAQGVRQVKCPHCGYLLLNQASSSLSRRENRSRKAKPVAELPAPAPPQVPRTLDIQLADLPVGTALVRRQQPEQVWYVLELDLRKGAELITLARLGAKTGRQFTLEELNAVYDFPDRPAEE